MTLFTLASLAVIQCSSSKRPLLLTPSISAFSPYATYFPSSLSMSLPALLIKRFKCKVSPSGRWLISSPTQAQIPQGHRQAERHPAG